MHVKVFLIADFANTDNAGKLNILGIFTALYAANFPAIHPQLHIVTKLAFDWAEFGQERELIIKLFDPDAKQMAVISRPFQIPSPKLGQVAEMNFIVGIRDIAFSQPGSYEFRLFVDKDQKDIQTLEVVQLPPQATGSAPLENE